MKHAYRRSCFLVGARHARLCDTANTRFSISRKRGLTVLSTFLSAIMLMSICAGAAAQAQNSTWEFSGRVSRADTGAPIAGAKVYYRGIGDASDSDGRVVNPKSLEGEVTTGPDGSYLISGLENGGYRLRVTATGFLSAATNGGPKPTAWKKCPPCTSSDRGNDLSSSPTRFTCPR